MKGFLALVELAAVVVLAEVVAVGIYVLLVRLLLDPIVTTFCHPNCHFLS